MKIVYVLYLRVVCIDRESKYNKSVENRYAMYVLRVFAGIACVLITVFSLFCKVVGLRNTHNYKYSIPNYNSNKY